jgi:hypothetical protein
LDPNGLYGKEALNKLNSLQNMGYWFFFNI